MNEAKKARKQIEDLLATGKCEDVINKIEQVFMTMLYEELYEAPEVVRLRLFIFGTFQFRFHYKVEKKRCELIGDWGDRFKDTINTIEQYLTTKFYEIREDIRPIFYSTVV